jgi:mobilization protein NikA
MAILKRRTKLVSFRLSDEEYERVQGACIADGARSISDFARAALQRTATTAAPSELPQNGNSFDVRTQELIETMRELTRQLGQLNSLIRSDR